MVLENTEKLAEKRSFNRQDLYQVFRESGCTDGEESMKKRLQKMLKSNAIARVGRNAYCVPAKGMRRYEYKYSDLSCDAAELIIKKHPYLNFSIFELIQLNEFINHQLVHNIVFISIESDLMDFAFDSLKEAYPGKVLVNPTLDIYNKYWTDNMIVVTKMVTESPKDKEQKWHSRIEKILVDLMSVPILRESVSESEFPAIFDGVFSKYIVNESCLLRYAKRRSSEETLRKFIAENTNIILRTE